MRKGGEQEIKKKRKNHKERIKIEYDVHGERKMRSNLCENKVYRRPGQISEIDKKLD